MTRYLPILVLLAGCPAEKQIVRTEVVNVPVEVRARIPDQYLTDRGVAEPQPLCKLAGPPAIVVFCQDQLARLIDSYRAVVRQSNADKQAIRSLQPPLEKTP